MGATPPPLRYYLERVLRDMGGILHWAAKLCNEALHCIFSRFLHRTLYHLNPLGSLSHLVAGRSTSRWHGNYSQFSDPIHHDQHGRMTRHAKICALRWTSIKTLRLSVSFFAKKDREISSRYCRLQRVSRHRFAMLSSETTSASLPSNEFHQRETNCQQSL